MYAFLKMYTVFHLRLKQAYFLISDEPNEGSIALYIFLTWPSIEPNEMGTFPVFLRQSPYHTNGSGKILIKKSKCAYENVGIILFQPLQKRNYFAQITQK